MYLSSIVVFRCLRNTIFMRNVILNQYRLITSNTNIRKGNSTIQDKSEVSNTITASSLSTRMPESKGFEIRTERHSLVVDSLPPFIKGPCPKQLLNGALASCLGMTMQGFYDKSRKTSQLFKEGKQITKWDICIKEIYENPEKTNGPPGSFNIEVNTFPCSLNKKQAERLKRVATTYCPVLNSLNVPFQIKFCEPIDSGS